MITLGIETSCDETALCLLETRGDYPALEYRVLAHLIHSQIDVHSKYGGVYPMMAKREHAKRIVPLLEQTIRESGIETKKIEAIQSDDPAGPQSTLENIRKICGEHDEDLWRSIVASSLIKEKPAIDRIAVTHGPGLEPALWVGINFANALSELWRVPVIGENHMEGHIASSILPQTEIRHDFEKLINCPFPAMAFLLSGGHTEIVLVKKIGQYEILGQTRDDAAGEAFDKVARMLGLPYPGGPEISRMAEIERTKRTKADISAISLPRPMIDADTLDMSFAGLKTAVLYELRKHEKIDEHLKMEVAREFEDAVTDVVIAKLERAFGSHEAHALIVGGGVFANKHILLTCKEFSARRGIAFLHPARGLSGDNALMIAMASVINGKIMPSATIEDGFKVEGIRAQGNLSL
jgi:N6-L-threonylcarbamoyladenine synthase